MTGKDEGGDGGDGGSSSDDGPMISSPEASDAEGSSSAADKNDGPPSVSQQQPPPGGGGRKAHHDDVFKFQARRFSKAHPCPDGGDNGGNDGRPSRCPDPQPPRSRRRGRPRKADPLGVDEKLDLLERKQRARRSSSRGGDGWMDSGDDDSDSDLEHTTTSKKKYRGGKAEPAGNGDVGAAVPTPVYTAAAASVPSSTTGGRVTGGTRASGRLASQASPSSAPPPVAATNKPSSPVVYELSSSSSDKDDDDDDDDGGGGSTGHGVESPRLAALPADVAEVIRRSHLAKTKLAQAQRYHADDIVVVIEDPVLRTPLRVPFSSASAPAAARPTAASLPSKRAALGAALRFTCRVQLQLAAGTKQPRRELTVGLRYHEKLSVVEDKLRKTLEVPPTARVVMDFDGNVLDRDKAPGDYEMEDEDMIDVSIVANS